MSFEIDNEFIDLAYPNKDTKIEPIEVARPVINTRKLNENVKESSPVGDDFFYPQKMSIKMGAKTPRTFASYC